MYYCTTTLPHDVTSWRACACPAIVPLQQLQKCAAAGGRAQYRAISGVPPRGAQILSQTGVQQREEWRVSALDTCHTCHESQPGAGAGAALGPQQQLRHEYQ